MEPNTMNPDKTLQQSYMGTAADNKGFVLLRREVSLKVICESQIFNLWYLHCFFFTPTNKYTID